MITLKLKPWVIIDNLEHVGTSWQVASDIDFINILDNVENSSVDLNLYLSPVIVPVGETYWIRAKRHLRNSDDNTIVETDWITPRPVVNTDNDSNLIIAKDIKIDKPIVYVKRSEILDDNLESFTIRTSEFRCEGEGHYATHWFIRDKNNNILFSSLYDQDNKTSIEVNKSNLSLIDKNTITISAIHLTPTNIESPIGTTIVSLFDFNFEIISNMDRVLPYNDYAIKLEKNRPELKTGIIRVELLDSKSKSLIWKNDIEDDITTIIIPGDVLGPSSNYIVDFYVESSTVDSAIKRKRLITVNTNISESLDFSYEYKKELKYNNQLGISHIPRGVSTKEIYDGLIPVCLDNDNYLQKFKYDREHNRLVSTGEIFNGVSLLNNNNEDTFIKYTIDNKIVIDTLGNDGYPVFLIYNYNSYNNTSVLERVIERSNETIPLGRTNSIVFINKENFYYIPVDSNVIKSVNIVTGTIEDVATVPTIVDGESLLANIGRNRLFVYTGTGTIGYSFNIDNHSFIESLTIPTKFRNRGLKSNRLVNGDLIIYRNEHRAEDTDNNILYFDYDAGTITELEFDLNSAINLHTNISLITGKVVFLDTSDTQDKYFEFK